MRALNSILLAGLVCVLAACTPRGETRSVDQIIETAQQRYAESAKGKTLPGALTQLAAKLQEFSKSTSDNAQTAGEIGELLGELSQSAGYTSRPGFGELQKQFQFFSSAGLQPNERKAAVELLSARTYHALAAELETAAFGVS